MTTHTTATVPISDITAVVKTFARPKSLDRLIRSIRKFYPDLRIIVADDSQEAEPRSDVEYIRLPYDSGVGAGRNALLRSVKTPYFLTLDDDFELTKETCVEHLAQTVANGHAHIAAGNALRCKRRFFRISYRSQPYFGTMEIGNGQLKLTPGIRSQHDGYALCDIVPQFFVADTAAIKGIGGWCDDLKTQDHQEFFVRVLGGGLKVAYCPTVSCLHWFTMPKEYAHFRHRDYRGAAAKKMGITTWIDMSGRTFHFSEDGEMTHITEPRKEAA